MSSTVRPDNLRAALDARLAAAMSQAVELREAELPRVTPHLNAREIVGAFLQYARGVHAIVDAFGKAQVGDLQLASWHAQWTQALSHDDRALWRQLSDEPGMPAPPPGAALVDLEISVAPDPSITGEHPALGTRADVRKKLVRFAAYPSKAASDVCGEYLRLAKRLAADFVRDHARFLP
jgi:hypothetical protein